MAARKAVYAVMFILIIGAASFAVYQRFFAVPASPCAPINGGSSDTLSLKGTTFGPVTEYALPSQGRWPTAIAGAPDGSVWFVEQELPGVGHFFPGNGTLVEYAWPGYASPKPPNCEPQVSSSGIALWNGGVWAADEFDNKIVGLNPSDGSVVSYSTAGRANFPYWVAVGPAGNLWFTSDSSPPRLGEISPNGTMSIVSLAGLGNNLPLQLKFVNSSLAFIAALDVSSANGTNTCVCDGHVYSFDPSQVGETITPSLVGGDFKIILPTSVAYSDGRVWVAQHGTSRVASYDFATKEWTTWPTTTVPWSATYPYYVVAGVDGVWFNEHYANKIATIDPASGTLTEYSESSPPASTNLGIQNDEYIGTTDGRLWFTSMSGNYVGFVQEGFDPDFHIGVVGSSSAGAVGGDTLNFTLRVSGSWSGPLSVNVSDSENYSSVPDKILIATNATTIPASDTPVNLGVTVRLPLGLSPGSYTIAVTVTSGGIQQAAFLFVEVGLVP